MECYVKSRKLTVSPEQFIEKLIRDFEVCAEQKSLNRSQMSLFFVNASADPARQFFLIHCSSDMPYEQIVNIMRRN